MPATAAAAARKRMVASCAKRRENDDDDDEDSEDGTNKPGMEEAFRMLDALKSLDDDDDAASSKTPPTPEAEKLDRKVLEATDLSSDNSVSPEKEIQVYKDMVNELETNQDVEMYTEMMDKLGGATKQTDDTYSQVMADMGGTTSSSSSSKKDKEEEDVPKMDLNDNEKTTEQFLNEALNEALKEVKVNNPKISSDQNSILDDKEIMKEIEDIFEKGNEKLMASLEEIRKEQQVLSQSSASKNADEAMGALQDDAQRLQKAEQSMSKMLQKVELETKNVEQAMQDLEQANQQVDNNILYQLKRGGLPKQASLVGLVLFATRSILDSVAAVNSGDPSYLTAALVQGAIAIVCAAIFFLL